MPVKPPFVAYAILQLLLLLKFVKVFYERTNSLFHQTWHDGAHCPEAGSADRQTDQRDCERYSHKIPDSSSRD